MHGECRPREGRHCMRDLIPSRSVLYGMSPVFVHRKSGLADGGGGGKDTHTICILRATVWDSGSRRNPSSNTPDREPTLPCRKLNTSAQSFRRRRNQSVATSCCLSSPNGGIPQIARA